MLLPLWEHGLKPLSSATNTRASRLLPLWEHGLKPLGTLLQSESGYVAPFMGAWIETLRCKRASGDTTLLPLWEHGLKLRLIKKDSHGNKCCSLYGSMDWNFDKSLRSHQRFGCSLYGSMDWNTNHGFKLILKRLLLPLWEHGLKPST